MKTSVVIATFGRQEFLRRSLDSLSAQTVSEKDFTVVICNHGGQAEVTGICNEYSRTLRLKEVCMQRHGFNVAEPKNCGIHAAKTGLVIVVDCGIVCPPRFIESHMAEHLRHPRAYVAGEVLGWDCETKSPFWNSLNPRQCPKKSEFPIQVRDYRLDMLDAAEHAPWTLFWGCNFSVNIEHLMTTGGYDPTFSGWGWDDLELGYRLNRAGLNFRYSRKAWAVHLPHRRLTPEERFSQATTNWLRACGKHMDPDLEPWTVCEYRDIPRTVGRLQEICRREMQHRKPPMLPPGTAALGFRAARNSYLLEFKNPDGQHMTRRTFGLRMPASDNQFSEIVISSSLNALQFEASMGFGSVYSHVIREARRIAGKVATARAIDA